MVGCGRRKPLHDFRLSSRLRNMLPHFHPKFVGFIGCPISSFFPVMKLKSPLPAIDGQHSSCLTGQSAVRFSGHSNHKWCQLPRKRVTTGRSSSLSVCLSICLSLFSNGKRTVWSSDMWHWSKSLWKSMIHSIFIPQLNDHAIRTN